MKMPELWWLVLLAARMVWTPMGVFSTNVPYFTTAQSPVRVHLISARLPTPFIAPGRRQHCCSVISGSGYVENTLKERSGKVCTPGVPFGVFRSCTM